MITCVPEGPGDRFSAGLREQHLPFLPQSGAYRMAFFEKSMIRRVVMYRVVTNISRGK